MKIETAAKLFALVFDLETFGKWESGQGEPIGIFARQLAAALGDNLIPDGLPRAVGDFDGTKFDIVLLHFDETTDMWFGYCPKNADGYWWRPDELVSTGMLTGKNDENGA